MATTTNYGWTTPDDTALVKDGAAAIRTLGSSIDTSVKSLNAGTTAGDLDYYTSATAKTRVAIGTSGQSLTVVGGVPAWAASPTSVLTAKGDVLTATAANTIARIGVGANDTVLTADSTTATGLKWATPAAGGMTSLASGSLSGTSVTISSINQTYNGLILRILSPRIASGTGTNILVRPNNTATAGVDISYIVSSSTVVLQASSRTGYWGNNVQTTTTVNNSFVEYYFPNYASTTNPKVAQILSFADSNNSGIGSSARITDTAAITSLVIADNNANTFNGGTYVLYGVK